MPTSSPFLPVLPQFAGELVDVALGLGKNNSLVLLLPHNVVHELDQLARLVIVCTEDRDPLQKPRLEAALAKA